MKNNIFLLLFLLIWTIGFLVVIDPKVVDQRQSNLFGKRELLGYNKNAEWLHDLPRNTLSGTKVQPTLFLASATDYYSSLAAMAFVPFAFGVLSGIVGIVYCCLRFVCWKEEEEKGEEPNRTDRIRIVVIFIVFSLIFLAMIIIGLIGNSYFQPAMTNFFNSVYQESITEKARIDLFQPIFDSINYNLTQSMGFVAALNSYGQITINSALNGKNDVGDNNIWRLVILGITYGVVGIIIILSNLGIILKNGKLSLAAGIIGFLAMFLTWINFGIHFPFSVVVADMCYDIEEYGIQQRLDDRLATNGTNYGGLNDLLACPSWRDSFLTYEYTFVLENNIQIEIDGTSNETQISEYQSQINLLTAIRPIAYNLTECEWIVDVLNPYGNLMCGNYLNGLVIIWASNFVIFVFLIPYTVFAIKGYRILDGKDRDGFF